MKKAPYAAFLLGSLFIGSITLTAIAFLHQTPTIKPDGLDLDKLIHGQFLHLLMVKDFWSIYPALPSANLLFTPLNALIFMAILLGCEILWAYQRKVHPLVVNTILLLTALFPYGIGLAALVNNDRPENAGWWLAFMLVGVFYAAMTCALFSSIQIARKWPQLVLKKLMRLFLPEQ